MEQQRSALARIGIVLLNFVASGLGLLRVGKWRAALVFLGLSMAVFLFFAFAPVVPFLVLILVVAIGVGSAVAGMWLSWWNSRTTAIDTRWYSRWYSIAGVGLLAVAINFVLTDPNRLRYRSFYTPGESMAPTLPKNDRFIAFMGPSRPLRRGDLVLVRTDRGETYVKRVAALAGDRFEMRNGIVTLNGVATPQHLVGVDQVKGPLGTENAQKFVEQFPGELSHHEIYELGSSPGDDFSEITVRSGFVLVLGDNRDRSADSRFPISVGGLGGPIPMTRILGRPLYQSWGSSRPMGTKLLN